MDMPMAQPQNDLSLPVKVLFVCMGNICRSPSAEGVFRSQVALAGLQEAILVASAGTHDYHLGRPADPRSAAAAHRRGIDLSAHKAQYLCAIHFEEFDYILVMDAQNYRDAMQHCPDEHQEKVHYFLDFASDVAEREVPDPYYGGARGFEHVLDLIEAASIGLLADICLRYESVLMDAKLLRG